MTTQPSDAISPLPDRRYGGLRDHEFYWRERQAWLAEQGYMLRPRYRPDWKPSWHDSGQFFFDCEDGHAPTVRLGFTFFPSSQLTLCCPYCI